MYLVTIFKLQSLVQTLAYDWLKFKNFLSLSLITYVVTFVLQHWPISDILEQRMSGLISSFVVYNGEMTYKFS